ncbi:MAG: 1,2-phenylacetyl-CoA epoxidase subunit PaaD [Chloroflexota bacterium]
MTEKTEITKETVLTALETVMDPEIPVISLLEMGIIRDVEMGNGRVEVTLTPTFSGCPALVEMETLIHEAIIALDDVEVIVHKQFNPPWTSDWISDEGRQKLKHFGLQPPNRHGGNLVMTFFDVVTCPRCESKNTTLKNSFGSTLCRAIWYCNSCQEPFEQFKPL